jgi:hypothetical protein
VETKELKNPETEDVRVAVNSSAHGNGEGCQSAEEWGLEVQRKIVKWAENLVDLPNKFCPECGKSFTYDQEIVEVSGNLVIVLHYNCFKQIFEEGDC